VARRKSTIARDPGSTDRQSLRLNSPLLVQWEYASEERLAQRNAAYRELIEGVNAEDVAFEAVAETRPAHVLEVGCGTGEFAERVAREIGARVVAVDLSRRMVELTIARGIDARVADVQALPFGDGEFECVVANWVLYHVPDLERGLLELSRVLRPGGTLVAATLGVGNLRDLWELLGDATPRDLSFRNDNGAARLAAHFDDVECRDASGTVVFPNPETMRAFVAATITRAHLAERVPHFDKPFRARCEHVVFVARKPA
jgi:SAM-dependent methyltransferase